MYTTMLIYSLRYKLIMLAYPMLICKAIMIIYLLFVNFSSCFLERL